MLTLVSESLGRTRTFTEVARELNLSPTCFANAEALDKLLAGDARRIILLAEDDLCEATLESLEKACGHLQFGLILCADREGLRSSNRAELLRRATELANLEWLSPDYDIDALCTAARDCRPHMLRVSKQDLEAAIIERQFIIQYQPKVERNNGSEWITREAEALIRWRHPRHGMLGPLEFLPEAEEFGLMGSVSELVLNEAAAQLVKWREQDFNLNSCINLASSLLIDPRFPDNYVAIVQEHGLQPANFTFEVNEKDVADSSGPAR